MRFVLLVLLLLLLCCPETLMTQRLVHLQQGLTDMCWQALGRQHPVGGCMHLGH